MIKIEDITRERLDTDAVFLAQVLDRKVDKPDDVEGLLPSLYPDVVQTCKRIKELFEVGHRNVAEELLPNVTATPGMLMVAWANMTRLETRDLTPFVRWVHSRLIRDILSIFTPEVIKSSGV